MRFLFAVAFYSALMFGAEQAAHAATITFSAGGTTRTYTITNANAARIVAYATATYGTLADGTVNPDPVGSMLDAIWSGIQNNVLRVERETAHSRVADPADIK